MLTEKERKSKKRIYDKRYYNSHPWAKTLNRILTRCNGKSYRYYKRGIRNFLKVKDLKYLWFRDKAYLLNRPSIDRINGDGHYTLENCRYIELYDNFLPKPIYQKDLNGKILKKFRSTSEAVRAMGCSLNTISRGMLKKQEIIVGYKWEYVNNDA